MAVIVRGVLFLARAVARGRRGRRGGRGGRHRYDEGQNKAPHAPISKKSQFPGQWRFVCLPSRRGEFEA